MSELLVLGASHRTAPVALRERLTPSPGQVGELLDTVLGTEAVQEAVVLSTCNRTELYLVVGDPVEAETAVLSTLARRAHVRPTELVEGLYSLRNCEVARHLFRVVSGLDSMIVGESEVQGQVKRAYEAALAARATGPLSNRLFHAALATGKRVRSSTGISAGHASVASVAVELARETLGELGARDVLIIGAGETAELTAQALHAQGVRSMFVANRRRERADALAERFGGHAIAFDGLSQELGKADIVIASTASPHTLIAPEQVEAAMADRGVDRPLLLIDLAVPRDVEAACADIPGVTLYDVDDLSAIAERNRSTRLGEAERAETIVEEEIHTFARWLGSLEVTPTIAALHQRGDAIVQSVLAENDGRWEGATDRDRERIAAVARTVANRLLHEPTRQVRRIEPERRHAHIELLRELFALEDDGTDTSAEGSAPVAELHTLPRRGATAG